MGGGGGMAKTEGCHNREKREEKRERNLKQTSVNGADGEIELIYTTALIIIQNGIKARPIPIKKILIPQRIEIPQPSVRIA